MSRNDRDYYSLLGIHRRASVSEIDRAYRRAARATHPDTHPDDGSAAERFNAVTVAYQTLRDPDRRASYDRAHPSLRRIMGSPSVELERQYRRPDARGLGPVWLGRSSRLPVPPVQLGAPRGAAPARTPEDELLGLAAALLRVLDPSRRLT